MSPLRPPSEGERLPPFSLPSSTGETLSLEGYRHRKNLVLFFYHGAACPSCRSYLAALATNTLRFEEYRAQVLAISTDPPEASIRLVEEMELPFPLLSDPTGEVVERFTERDEEGHSSPALYLTDRFGALFASWRVAEADRLPGREKILNTLLFIELQCPECEA
jgi:peroxiredoxin